jgi:GT2 family glycosyltransferase
MLRRERLRKTGLFDTSLRHSGEDYDFHFRATSHGPVVLLDFPTIRYRVGAPDQLSHRQWMIHVARNNLATIMKYFGDTGCQIKFSEELVKRRLAESYAFLGEAELFHGETLQAAVHLSRSLRYRANMYTASRLALCLLPPSVFRIARHARRTFLRSLALI